MTVLDDMRRRRVTRHFLDQPVSTADMRTVVRAAGWASSAGNRSIHRFMVVRDPATIKSIRPFAPGILDAPPAVIVMSTDRELARQQYVQLDRDMNTWIDIGTSLMCMMLAAQSIGLGSCPATSFSQSAVSRVLRLPDTLLPELLLLVGHPGEAPTRPPGPRIAKPKAVIDWERVGETEPGD